MLNQLINSSIINQNWLWLHLKHCSFLTNDKCGQCQSGIQLQNYADTKIYERIFFLQHVRYKYWYVQNVLRRAHNLPAVKNVKNFAILCGTSNLHLDAPEDIADDIIEIGSTFKRFYSNVNVFFCGILPRDCYWSINQVYIKDVNKILKSNYVRFLFSYIVQNTDWTLANSSLRLVGKGNSKLSKSIRKSIEDFYDIGNTTIIS